LPKVIMLGVGSYHTACLCKYASFVPVFCEDYISGEEYQTHRTCNCMQSTTADASTGSYEPPPSLSLSLSLSEYRPTKQREAM